LEEAIADPEVGLILVELKMGTGTGDDILWVDIPGSAAAGPDSRLVLPE
jgi:hypothetical protein